MVYKIKKFLLVVAYALAFTVTGVSAYISYSLQAYALENNAAVAGGVYIENSNYVIRQIAQSDQAAKWCSPFNTKIVISRYFLKPVHKYAAGHRGIDIYSGDAELREIFAPAAGVVTFAGAVAGREVISVRIDNDTVYSLEPVKTDLKIGDAVTRCANIGRVEEFGHTKPSEVHLGVRVLDEYVNPIRYYAHKPKLLPLTKDIKYIF